MGKRGSGRQRGGKGDEETARRHRVQEAAEAWAAEVAQERPVVLVTCLRGTPENAGPDSGEEHTGERSGWQAPTTVASEEVGQFLARREPGTDHRRDIRRRDARPMNPQEARPPQNA